MQKNTDPLKDNNVPSGKDEASSGINILVVDDEEVIRSLLADALAEIGYNVELASSGEEAVEKIKHASFEILITDLRMPGMNGIEVIKKFKEINSDICIIVITGYPSLESAVEAMRQGAYDYITKPFKLDELRIIVRRAVEKQALRREKEIFKELSITDGLTRLYNRRYLDEVLPREISRASRYTHRLSIMMIDIDDFKIYNDTHGHLAGDELLRQLAQLLVGSIREIDFAFRYGGEEFAVILLETGKEEATCVARRIRSLVEQTKFKGADVFTGGALTVSIGLAIYPEDAESKDELVSKADQALYQAKRLGKNRVCFFEIRDPKIIGGQ
jgi:two-component system cell cycle response regulator